MSRCRQLFVRISTSFVLYLVESCRHVRKTKILVYVVYVVYSLSENHTLRSLSVSKNIRRLFRNRYGGIPQPPPAPLLDFDDVAGVMRHSAPITSFGCRCCVVAVEGVLGSGGGQRVSAV